MNVQEIIVALLGVDPKTEVCVSDANGGEVSISRVEVTHSYGSTYVNAVIDGQLEADAQ